jgi:hypothetical protein
VVTSREGKPLVLVASRRRHLLWLVAALCSHPLEHRSRFPPGPRQQKEMP